MQPETYGVPKEPELDDAARLFVGAVGGELEVDEVIPLLHGSRVHIIGQAPKFQPQDFTSRGNIQDERAKESRPIFQRRSLALKPVQQKRFLSIEVVFLLC